jgi:glycosyltransferase involved in cell wall biosynthesis
MIAALGLEDKRKNVAWLLDCVAQIPAHLPYRLVLAGAASPAFEQSVRARLPQVSFTGLLSRAQLLHHMQQADIFLMGSVVEDWGYVQVEAMAMGMVVVAPAQVPCSEIVGDDSCLFKPGSNADCVQKLAALLAAGPALQGYKARFRQRYEQCFSAPVFGDALQQVVALNNSTASIPL